METQPLSLDRHIPELDGLRGIAILLVIFFHYFQSAPLPGSLAAFGRLSWSGVDLFFVLSGFLVGGILLDARDSPHYFKTFYIRRSYRILPLYAVVCAAFWILRGLAAADSSNPAFDWLFFTHSLPWYAYASLTQNFLMAYKGALGPAWLGATWSLAIEEQFYLTLPLMIRYASRRRLPYLLALIALAAPVCRALFRLFYVHGDVAAYVLMPCRADALMLGVGAALVMRSEAGRQFLLDHRRLLYAALTVLLCGMAYMAIKGTGAQTQIAVEQTIVQSTQTNGSGWTTLWVCVRTTVSSLNYTWIALFYLCLLLLALTHRASLWSRFLRARLLMQTGIIAYGAYLFHEPVLGLCYGLLRGRLPVIASFGDVGTTVLAFVLTVILAKVSWSYFEKPLVKRGHKHSYDEPGHKSAAAIRLPPEKRPFAADRQ
jgi:peptidoglycan/LPS O-acetylase OafA/YrhL